MVREGLAGFGPGLALCLLAACGPQVAPSPPPATYDMARSGPCEGYTAPETYDWLAWDRQAPHACYLSAARTLERFLGEASDEEMRNDIREDLATQYAAMGDTRRAMDILNTLAGPPPASSENFSLPPDTRLIPAHSAILKEAARARIVIINEAHHEPRHRAFTRSLLADLKKEGFTHFAAEALAPSPDDLRHSLRAGAPTQTSGTYTNEPQYANLIREALRLGFVVVPYEVSEAIDGPPPEGTYSYHAYREGNQAKHLYERVFAAGPDARLIVHVGYSHLIDTPQPRRVGEGEVQWMASRLRAMTGYDPLTIDQTVLTPNPDERRNSRAYRALVSQVDFTQPQVVMAGDAYASFGFYKDKVDMMVIHPGVPDVCSRPGWLVSSSKRLPIPALPAEMQDTRPILVQVYSEVDPAGAVPLDQIPIYDGQAIDETCLFVPQTHDQALRYSYQSNQE